MTSIFKYHRRSLISIILVFAVIYGLISLVNHYNFRTYAMDLGAYTNAMFDYVHFQWNDSGVFKAKHQNLLASHFDLYLIILSPFSLLFGTYTLLILQIACILLGGLGIYRLISHYQSRSFLPIVATLYFFSFFGVISALSFDYHSIVISASLIPWFLYFLAKGRLRAAALIFFFTLLGKENVSLWTFFICIGLLVEYWTDRPKRIFLSILALGSLLYFLLITSVIMPMALPDAEHGYQYPHFKYSFLGSNYGEAILFILSHPMDAILALFTNHTQSPFGDFIKAELHIFLLLCGLPLLFRKPHYLIMLIPLYAQKLFHDNHLMWGINAHYNVEFAVVLTVGIFTSIASISSTRWTNIFMISVTILSLGCTVRMMDDSVAFVDHSKIRFYQSSHYKRAYDVKQVHAALEEIPDDANVSAQSPFVPHLALRDHVYQFPLVKDAEYLVYSDFEGPYPRTEEVFQKHLNKILESNEWKEYYNMNGLIILQKKK